MYVERAAISALLKPITIDIDYKAEILGNHGFVDLFTDRFFV